MCRGKTGGGGGGLLKDGNDVLCMSGRVPRKGIDSVVIGKGGGRQQAKLAMST